MRKCAFNMKVQFYGRCIATFANSSWAPQPRWEHSYMEPSFGKIAPMSQCQIATNEPKGPIE